MRFPLRLAVLFLALLMSAACFASEPYRVIAIMENERLLEAEPAVTLVSFFHSPNAKIRERAVLAAAHIGNKAVLSDLVPLTKDKSVDVRKMVAFALGQIRSKEGLNAALSMLKDSDAEVRRMAIEASGRIGGMEVTESLTPFLDDPNATLREQAALALALIKDKGSVDALIKKAGADDPAQWAYGYALYRLADDRAVPVLHQVLAKPSPSPSTGDPSSLLFALKALWGLKKPLTAEEIQTLFKNADVRVQVNALDVLAAANDKTICPSIEKMYDGLPFSAKWKAIDTMGALGCTTRLPEILKDTDATLAGAALQALAKSQKDEALPELQKRYADPSWLIRWRTAQALGDLGAEAAIPILKTLMQDTDSMVKLEALDSLTKFLPETAELFVPFLDSDDFAVRATAADALGQTKDRKYLPLLLKTYDASFAANEIEARIAVLDILADYNTSEVLAIYKKALLDPEYTIRRHAIDGIKKLTGAQFFWNGKAEDPENFLYTNAKVTKAMAAKYPADLGDPVPDKTVEMKLDKGTVVIRLLGSMAPVHVLNFVKLAQKGFYDGLRIHRVVPNFVIQGGDPRGDGWGNAGELVHDQYNMLTYLRGMVGMPIAGKDSGGSQFFITLSRQPHLDGNYTIFGEVVSGMEFVDQTELGDKILSVKIQ